MSLVEDTARGASPEPMTFATDDWSTTYEVPAEKVSLLLKDLAEFGEWATVEFHATGIVGRVLDKTHVAIGQSVISENGIAEAGAHCEVAVNVGEIEELNPSFLASSQDVEMEIDRDAETLTVKEAPYAEKFELKAASQTRSQRWPVVEYGTTARMKGWEFCAAIEGACGATDRGFVFDADLNDIEVSSRDTPWETTLEDVVVETVFDTTQFSTWFWPEICDRIHVEDDLEVRFGQNKPVEVQIEDRVEYAVAPQLPSDDEDSGGESA